jgi:hypothetical protein
MTEWPNDLFGHSLSWPSAEFEDIYFITCEAMAPFGRSSQPAKKRCGRLRGLAGLSRRAEVLTKGEAAALRN